MIVGWCDQCPGISGWVSAEGCDGVEQLGRGSVGVVHSVCWLVVAVVLGVVVVSLSDGMTRASARI